MDIRFHGPWDPRRLARRRPEGAAKDRVRFAKAEDEEVGGKEEEDVHLMKQRKIHSKQQHNIYIYIYVCIYGAVMF